MIPTSIKVIKVTINTGKITLAATEKKPKIFIFRKHYRISSLSVQNMGYSERSHFILRFDNLRNVTNEPSNMSKNSQCSNFLSHSIPLFDALRNVTNEPADMSKNSQCSNFFLTTYVNLIKIKTVGLTTFI